MEEFALVLLTKQNNTEREMMKNRAIRKVEKAIDAIVALQDMGFGDPDTQRILDALNALWARLNQT